VTRQDRGIALATALAWLAASEAVDAATPGSAQQSALRREEGALDHALDAITERLNVDVEDIVAEAERMRVMLEASAVGWERREREAAEAAERRGMERAGLLEPLA
jgi:hypothetical protein